MADRLRINFTLWTASLSGGTRHIFEVANGLTRRGHDVTITSLAGDHRWFPLEASLDYVKPPPWLRVAAPLARVVKKRGVRYSDIDGVAKLLGLNVDIDLITPLAEAIPECDANVATFCLTAPAVCRSGKGAGFYYIQHYEPPFFQNSRDILAARETYHLPLKKMVTSAWLERLVYRMTGERAVARVGIGLNPGVFYPRPVSRKAGEKVVMALIRGIKWKNELDIIKIMNIVAGKIPGIKLLAVGREKAFTEAVLRLLADEPRRRAMGEQAARAAQRYAIPAAAARLVQAYEAAVAAGPRPAKKILWLSR